MGADWKMNFLARGEEVEHPPLVQRCVCVCVCVRVWRSVYICATLRRCAGRVMVGEVEGSMTKMFDMRKVEL